MSARRDLLTLVAAFGESGAARKLGVSESTIDRWLERGPSARGERLIADVASRQKSIDWKLAQSFVERLRGASLTRAYRSVEEREDLRDVVREARALMRKRPEERVVKRARPTRIEEAREWYELSYPRFRMPSFRQIIRRQSGLRQLMGRDLDAYVNALSQWAKTIHTVLDDPSYYPVRTFFEAFIALMVAMTDEVAISDVLEFITESQFRLWISALRRSAVYFRDMGREDIAASIKKVIKRLKMLWGDDRPELEVEDERDTP